MYSKSGKNSWVMLMFILAGMVVGGFIGTHLPGLPYLTWLQYGQSFGLSQPLSLDLGMLSVSFGFNFTINIAGILGIAIAIFLYRRL